MNADLIAQSPTIAKAMPITPKFIQIPKMMDKMTRHTTVEKIEVYIVYLTSPQARSPFDKEEAIGHNKALNTL